MNQYNTELFNDIADAISKEVGRHPLFSEINSYAYPWVVGGAIRDIALTIKKRHTKYKLIETIACNSRAEKLKLLSKIRNAHPVKVKDLDIVVNNVTADDTNDFNKRRSVSASPSDYSECRRIQSNNEYSVMVELFDLSNSKFYYKNIPQPPPKFNLNLIQPGKKVIKQSYEPSMWYYKDKHRAMLDGQYVDIDATDMSNIRFARCDKSYDISGYTSDELTIVQPMLSSLYFIDYNCNQIAYDIRTGVLSFTNEFLKWFESADQEVKLCSPAALFPGDQISRLKKYGEQYGFNISNVVNVHSELLSSLCKSDKFVYSPNN